MAVLVTGAAGFIGYHVAEALLARGEDVVGLDDLNAYYDPRLKQARLDRLAGRPGFRFVKGDIADEEALADAAGQGTIDRIVHLAAQAGVRYSIENPRAYVRSNLVGHVNVLELARGLGAELKHLVYASSSSVYGGNDKAPFAETDAVEKPVSLYAATKRADELMSHAYAHLYGIPQTGLRFFTVYGPWGRPDMAYWLFTAALLSGKPIDVFAGGTLTRDFTYIDDIVAGILKVLDGPPERGAHRLYNIGNSSPVSVNDFIAVLERLTGKTAVRNELPMQPGDVRATHADTGALERDFGFRPSTPLDEGLARFVAWYRGWNGL
ncbi:MAG: NAD-dependent epimerase/dehydratase family protein [Alphaproteobacteria bacterium]|nr:NAD-dependent epimerase/dehydratase family protein [Alphaproteobacteria bacterium]